MRLTKSFQNFSDSQKRALDSRRNLAVRANAGSGKTSVLVERIAQILAQSWDDRKPLELTRIVAITFTRKAAAELEERLRRTFREMIELATDPKEKKYWADRTNELPRAMIGTIDSFCARILREFGLLDESPDRIEPDFQPMEGYEAEVLRWEAVERTIDQLAGGVRDGSGTSAENDRVEACRWWAEQEGYQVLTNFLVELLDHSTEPRKIAAAHQGLASPAERVQSAWENLPAIRAWNTERAALLRELQAIVKKTEGNEKQTVKYVRKPVQQALEVFGKSDPDAVNQALHHLRDALFTGKKTPRTTRGLKEIEKELVSLQEKWCPELESFCFDYAGEVRALEAADMLALLLETACENYMALCREANRFDFWIIARKTRDLLARDRKVRSDLKDRYRFVLVDEFQDTNQLQWEIISWVVGDGPAGSLEKDRLFMVGDPQQSIYRFRKADVGVFNRVQGIIQHANRSHSRDQSSTADEGVIRLQENYRSLKPIPLLLMDRVFEHVFGVAVLEVDPQRDKYQIQYQNLIAGIKSKAVGEVRYVVAGEPEADSGNEDEQDEAPATQDLPGRQVQAIVDQLESLQGQPKYIVEDDKFETLKWKDMAILLPSRDVVLGRLEKELARREIPYVVTSGIGFWQRQEIRDMVSLASYLADAGDELALFAVLRGPVGQLSDQEILFLSQLGRGSIHKGLSLLLDSREPFEPADHNNPRNQLGDCVQEPLKKFWANTDASERQKLYQVAARLDGWQKRVDRMAHADLLQRCLEESGAYAIYAAEPDGELMLANLQRLFEHIRGEESGSSPGLGRLARWMRDQVDDSLKEEQAVLAAAQDAVQIMTVHAAKGLEFPVVAVMKMERHVGRSRSPRLLVKSEWDQLLKEDEKDFLSIRPGTLAVTVRHPHRPRETYTPRLLKALRNLEQAQDLAESRRLFYVATTRAKERLILAGKQPRLKKDGEPRKLQTSWQKWFEDALGLTEEHKQKGMWHDPASDFKVSIITDVAPDAAKEAKASAPISQSMDLQYVHERSRSPSIATTGLEKMRETFRRSPHEWWLRYRVKVQPHMSKPISISEIRTPHSEKADVGLEVGDSEENLGMVIGTIVHRLFEMGEEVAELPQEDLIQTMAANLIASSQSELNGDEKDESPGVSSKAISKVVSSVQQIIERIRRKEYDAIRRLLKEKGEPEVEFLVPLGRWHVSGRFDKLLSRPGGFEIVDWKTDREADWQEIVKRYDNQMRLYALALYRSGRAALLDGNVCVHLALLHHGRVETLRYKPVELDEHAVILDKELRQMDEFGG